MNQKIKEQNHLIFGYCTSNKNMENIKEPLNCNEEGFCEIPANDHEEQPSTKGTSTKKSKLMYFGDPMCSWCWGPMSFS